MDPELLQQIVSQYAADGSAAVINIGTMLYERAEIPEQRVMTTFKLGLHEKPGKRDHRKPQADLYAPKVEVPLIEEVIDQPKRIPFVRVASNERPALLRRYRIDADYGLREWTPELHTEVKHWLANRKEIQAAREDVQKLRRKLHKALLDNDLQSQHELHAQIEDAVETLALLFMPSAEPPRRRAIKAGQQAASAA